MCHGASAQATLPALRDSFTHVLRIFALFDHVHQDGDFVVALQQTAFQVLYLSVRVLASLAKGNLLIFRRGLVPIPAGGSELERNIFQNSEGIFDLGER